MNILIVHAHPEPQSFNGALTQTAVSYLTKSGHQVTVSDLYAMDWEAKSGRGNFKASVDAAYFKQQAEEAFASENNGFVPEIQQEIDKLFACDILILQFPLSWFSMPAIMKGWVDRVFALGAVYGGGAWYDNGKFAGKRAMISLTTGGGASMYGPDGINGDIDTLLFPIQHGVLRLTGFDVLPPFISWAPASITPEAREQYLRDYEKRLKDLLQTPPLSFASLHDYDPETFRLRAPELEAVK
ncbi:NAD(P)H-dependent oxidoreductase [Duganella sp. CT11-25]|uniref:NAD(P)H-dependent oxidoreductase n=1 Tax=unclassified Duganella TaxID=2636909 RepID=UPI0039AF027F